MAHTLFSRNAYLAISKVLYKAYHKDTRLAQPAETHRRLTIRRVTQLLADMFQADNERFQRNRFIDATGVHDSILNEEEATNEQTTR